MILKICIEVLDIQLLVICNCPYNVGYKIIRINKKGTGKILIVKDNLNMRINEYLFLV